MTSGASSVTSITSGVAEPPDSTRRDLRTFFGSIFLVAFLALLASMACSTSITSGLLLTAAGLSSLISCFSSMTSCDGGFTSVMLDFISGVEIFFLKKF